MTTVRSNQIVGQIPSSNTAVILNPAEELSQAGVSVGRVGTAQPTRSSDMRSVSPLNLHFPLSTQIEGAIMPTTLRPQATVYLNTSNKGKYEEFQRLFSLHGAVLVASDKDLEEIDADPISVAVHKASSLGEGYLVEDTSLDIEGEDVGVNIRWLKDNLPQSIGKKAIWTVLLAIQDEGKVQLFQGKVSGKIVQSAGEGGFGFDPYFMPEGETQTLAQAKPDRANARALAVEAYFKGEVFAEKKPIVNWQGAWQLHDD